MTDGIDHEGHELSPVECGLSPGGCEQNFVTDEPVAPTELVDATQVATWFATLFGRADPEGYVSLRSLPERERTAGATTEVHRVADILADPQHAGRFVRQRARDGMLAAAVPATFKTGQCRREALYQAVAIVVDLDGNPNAGGRAVVEVLGEPTMAVASGGLWAAPDTNEPERKLHLYWVLDVPASTPSDLEKLRRCREHAVRIAGAGADKSGSNLVQAMRIGGSVHAKSEPRRVELLQVNADLTMNMDEALSRVERAVSAITRDGAGTPPEPDGDDDGRLQAAQATSSSDLQMYGAKALEGELDKDLRRKKRIEARANLPE